jgi:hypothetical protein
MLTFEDFFPRYLEAIRKRDIAFLKNVYLDLYETSGLAAGSAEEDDADKFFAMLPDMLKEFASPALKIGKIEQYDDFATVKMNSGDSEIEAAFRKKGDSWSFFDGRIGYVSFKKTYALSYQVNGEGSIRVLINGKRNPFVGDITGMGFISLINSALKVGKNEMTLQPLSAAPISARIQVSSAKSGEMLDTGQGDVLSWEGKIPGNGGKILSFNAE